LTLFTVGIIRLSFANCLLKLEGPNNDAAFRKKFHIVSKHFKTNKNYDIVTLQSVALYSNA